MESARRRGSLPQSEGDFWSWGSKGTGDFRHEPPLPPFGPRLAIESSVESRCGAVVLGWTYPFAAPFVWRCLNSPAVTP
ncbi:MAG: hypothetical protein P8Y36_04725, partial [Alphaproteobacteria bacterium]